MKRVLIVDDDPDICEAMQLLLETQYEVAVAYNGEQALARLEVESFDAIVLDLMMPVMDGESLVAELRRRGSAPPVIFASAAPHLISRARSAGVAGFLQKPFDADELESVLERVLSPSACGGRALSNGSYPTAGSSSANSRAGSSGKFAAFAH